MPDDRAEKLSFFGALRGAWLWPFERDPLYAAEKRHFLSGSPLIIYWIAFFLLGALPGNFAGLIVPLLVIAGLNADRRSGALDGLIMTTVDPLRLAAAKIASRCFPIIQMSLVGLLATSPLICAFSCLAGMFSWDEPPNAPDMWNPLIFWASRVFTMPLEMVVWSSVGLYFATRLRYPLVSVIATWALAIPFCLLALWVDAWLLASPYFLAPLAGVASEVLLLLLIGISALRGAIRRITIPLEGDY